MLRQEVRKVDGRRLMTRQNLSSLRLSLLVLLGLSFLHWPVEGSTIARCELRNLLYIYNVPGSAPDWMCIVANGGGYDTNYVTTKGSKSYHGIMSIPSDYCMGHVRANQTVCGTTLCSALQDNAVSDDLDCAQSIFGSHGYGAWPVWKTSCEGKDLSSYVDGCFQY